MKKLLSRKDIILIISLIFISVIGILVLYMHKPKGMYLSISIDGKEMASLKMDTDTEYIVDNSYGRNIIIIADGYAYVNEADCPDKICMNYNKISKVGETICCLPHKLIIEVVDHE